MDVGATILIGMYGKDTYISPHEYYAPKRSIDLHTLRR